MSWDDEVPTCLYCKHSDRHIKLINFRENDYSYYTWGCTNFGCECVINDPDDIKKWDSYRKERRENNDTPTCSVCDHSDEHLHGSYHPVNDYPYHIWSCTRWGCDCTISDKELIM